MQAASITSPAATRPYDIIQSDKPSQEMNLKESSQQRWKILFLICSSTIGPYFIQNLLANAGNQKLEVFNIYERTEMVDKELIMGYFSFIPMIAGVMIHRFGIKKIFCWFMVLVILGSLLIVPSFMVKSYSLYLWGDSLIRGSSLVLWVAQIYMITKWFKGRELSLAIGVLGVSKCISHLFAVPLSSYLETIGLLKVLFFGTILSVFLAGIFLKKIEMIIKQGDLQQEEEKDLNHSVSITLMVSIVCFAVGEGARSLYFSVMFPSHSGSLMLIITKSETFGTYAPVLLLPLFGSFADKEGGRRTAVFSSFILLFIGNMVFYFFASSDSVLFPLFASTLFQIGSCLFEVSFWATLGYLTPKKALAVILGIGLSLKEFGPRFFGPYMKVMGTLTGFAIGILLIVGIRCVLYAWKEVKGQEEDESKLVKNDMNKREETI